jgi:hypothetical protein
MRKTTNVVGDYQNIGKKSNDANDFIYNLDGMPYLHRCGEVRSYRL